MNQGSRDTRSISQKAVAGRRFIPLRVAARRGRTDHGFQTGFQSGPKPSAIHVRYEPEVSVTVTPKRSPTQPRKRRIRVPSGDPLGTPSTQSGADERLRSRSGLLGY